jgi:hypothetical protein
LVREDSTGWEKRGGGSTSLTWLIDWSLLSSPMMSFSAAATPEYSLTCRRGAG